MTPPKGQGGPNRGQGRKPSLNPAIKLATIKMTPDQHTRFIALGGSRWVKSLIDRHNRAERVLFKVEATPGTD
jgi:hypothetical protein